MTKTEGKRRKNKSGQAEKETQKPEDKNQQLTRIQNPAPKDGRKQLTPGGVRKTVVMTSNMTKVDFYFRQKL